MLSIWYQFGIIINLKQKKEEKRKEIEENRRQREQKRIEKEKELEEKKRIFDEQKRLIEQKKAEREAEKELRRRERDEKKRAEEEEKNKKKQEEEEKLRKQQMISNKFKSFFPKVSPEQKKKPKIGNLELQKDQSIANYVPEISKENFVLGAFDSQIIHQDTQMLYLAELRNQTRKPFKQGKQSNNQLNKNDDLIIDGSQNETKRYRAKLLQFHENLRPAYFGTWRKKSRFVTGRRPFKLENDLLDYDVESDLEWEEEEEGEIIKDSDSEKDKMEDEEEDQDEDDYELDDFFVPHGHLSDDENQDDEHCEIIETPDGQKKRKLLTKEKILIEERTKKLKRLVPKATGCLWQVNDEFENKAKFQHFEKYRVVFVS